MNTRLNAIADTEASTRYLFVWLLVALFFEYARPLGFVPGAGPLLKLNSLIPMTLLLLVAFKKELRPTEEIFADPLAKWIPIFFGMIAFSIVHADVTFYAFRTTTDMLGYVFLFIMVLRICTTMDRVRGVFAVLVVAHLFLLLMNPVVLLNPNERNYIRGGTFLGDGNDFSLSICILLPMAIELALSARSRLLRIAWWGGLLVLILAVIASSSRGGTLGMAAVAGYLWLRSDRKGLTLFLMLVAVAILLLYAGDIYFKRMGTITTYQSDGSAMGRIMAWTAALRMAGDNPLLGVGAGHFSVAFGTKYRPAGFEHIPWLTAHSSYFLVLGELGIPGLFVILRIVFGNIFANIKMRRLLEKKAELDARLPPGTVRLIYLQSASMIGFACAGAFLSAAYYPHIFILSALMISTRCIVRRALEAPAAQPAAADVAVDDGPRRSSIASAMLRRKRLPSHRN